MRQLVSVVTDASISYLVHDGEHTTQIAQVMNVGLGVADVITLGVNLGDVLRLPTMKLNGHGAHAVERQEPRALPPASKTAPKRKTKPERKLSPHEQKQRQRVACPVGGPRCSVDYKRTSVSRHLEDVHKWTHSEAMTYEHTAPSIDGVVIDMGGHATRSKYVDAALLDEARASVALDGQTQSVITPQRDGRANSDPKAARGRDGRLLVPRRSVTDEWPDATPAGVFAAIEAAGADGISTRELALQLTADSSRGRQTIGNKLMTLRSQNVIETFDGMRPHHKSGKPLPTMLIRVKR